MNEKPEAEKAKPEKAGRERGGTDRIDLLLVLLFALFMGSVLLVQYQKPLVVAALDKIFGKPQPAVTIPTLPATIPTMPPAPAPAPEEPAAHVRLPRETHGIKFMTSFAYAKPYILRKYDPEPKSRKVKGEYWRLLEDGTRVTKGRREIRLEYMGNETLQAPRYLSFDFYQYKFTGVVEKYFRLDPEPKLKSLVKIYGKYNAKDVWKGKYDRYLWDNGQMKIVFLVDRTSRASIFSFQMKEFERQLK